MKNRIGKKIKKKGYFSLTCSLHMYEKQRYISVMLIF